MPYNEAQKNATIKYMKNSNESLSMFSQSSMKKSKNMLTKKERELIP